MNESCVVVPRVKHREGKKLVEKESHLFTAIKGVVKDYETAWDIYAYTKTDDFKSKLDSSVEYDELGEVKLPSLIKVMGWEKAYDDSKGINDVIRDHGIENRVWKRPLDVVRVMNEINSQEKKFVAVAEKVAGGYKINISNRTSATENEAAIQSFNNSLSREIVSLLRELGFDVSVLTDPKYDGMFDPNNPSIVNGLIQVIKLARGERGEEALPEEFSHLIIEGLRNHPLVQRLLGTIDENLAREVLGEEFEKYAEKYEGDLDALKTEAAGKMLGEYISQKGTINDTSATKSRKSLLSRIWQWAKKMFSRITDRHIEVAKDTAYDTVASLYTMIANRRAIPLIDKQSILDSDKILYRISTNVNNIEELSRDARMRHATYVQALRRESTTRTVDQGVIKSQEAMNASTEEGSHVDVLNQFVSACTAELRELRNEIDRYNKNYETYTEIQDLNKVAGIVLKINDITSESGYFGVLKTLSSLSENYDKYDFPNGLKSLVINISNNAEQAVKELLNLRGVAAGITTKVLTNSFRTVFKTDRAIEGFGIKQKLMCLDQIIDHAERDISWVDSFFSAMSDADDPLLVFTDSLVKNQHFDRDNEVRDIFKRVAVLEKKLRDAGYTSEFMLELDKDGVPTGKIISEYDFDSYRAAKDKFIDELKAEGISGAERKRLINNWKTATINGESRTIRKYVNPKYEKMLKEGRRKDIPKDAAYEELPNPKVFDKNANRINNLAEAQRDYYYAMIELKREMMSKIPQRGQFIYRAINISEDLTEGILENHTGNILNSAAEYFKKKFVRRPDDLGFGITDNTQTAIEEILKKEKDPGKAATEVIKMLSDEVDPDIKQYVSEGAIKNKIINNKDDVTKAAKEIIERVSLENFYVVDTGFNGEIVQSLPIYYSRRLKNPKMMSRDFSGCMVAYSAMAINYDKMSKIINILELVRDQINKEDGRRVNETRGNKSMTSAFTVAGDKFRRIVTKSGNKSAIADRYDAFMESVAYEQRKKVETFEIADVNLDLGKILDTIRDYSGLLGLGLNVFSAFSNLTVGKVQQWIEAAGGEHFKLKHYAKAIKQYGELIGGCVAEMGSPIKKNKLSLLIEMFDPMGDYFESLRTTRLSKGYTARILGENGLGYIGMHAGEHILHCQTMLAILNAQTLYDKENNEISLFDALDVVEENGIYKLKLKEGLSYKRQIIDTSGNQKSNKNWGKPLRDEDNKIVEELVSLDDKQNFRDYTYKRKRIIRKVNDQLNGAFSADDKGAAHRYAVFRLVLQFRQWMPAHYMRRFARGHWDDDLEQWVEGYYTTILRLSNEMVLDLRKGQTQLILDTLKGKNLSEHEIANIRRASFEVGLFLTLMMILNTGDSIKDRDTVWGERMLLYQLYRMKLEVGASVPSPTFIKNLITLLNSPAPTVNTLQRVTNMINFTDMFEEVKSGRYEGWSEWQKDLFLLAPYTDQIMKAVYFDSSMFTQFRK